MFAAEEQRLKFQMTDMLALQDGSIDLGGASIKLATLSDAEADAQDATEFNAKQAYGAREEDLVTFIQVRPRLLLQLPKTFSVHSKGCSPS